MPMCPMRPESYSSQYGLNSDTNDKMPTTIKAEEAKR